MPAQLTRVEVVEAGRFPARAPREACRVALGGVELGVWVAALLAVAILRLALVGGPRLTNDSYQYLSVAENLERHGGIATSIVHFDTERAAGRVPAPETTFPPGYPMLLWAFSWTRLPREWLGLALSLLSALAVLPLLRIAARALGLPTNGARVALLGWAFSAQASLYAVTVCTDAVFTAVTVAALVLLLVEERDGSRARWLVPLACFLAAASYWIRYAGLFLVAALHVLAAARIARGRARADVWLPSLLGCDVVVAALMARNVAIAGTWMGGNARPVRHEVGYVLHRFGVAGYELVFGSVTSPLSFPFALYVGLALVGGLGAGIVALRARSEGRVLRAPAPRAGVGGLLTYVVVYCAAMAYAGFTSQVSVGARLFLPLLPVAVLVIVVLLSSSAPRSPQLARILALSLVPLVASNAWSSFQEPPPSPHDVVARALREPMPDGVPLERWLRSSIPRDGVVLSLEGQATGYVLDRRTISAAGRKFTDMTWSDEETHETMARFGAAHLIVYPDVVATGAIELADSALFRQLVSRRPPGWLELAAENPHVLVFRRIR